MENNVTLIEKGLTFLVETEKGNYLVKETKSKSYDYIECTVYTEDGTLVEDMELISELYNSVKNQNIEA